jgi:hypothetical protein
MPGTREAVILRSPDSLHRDDEGSRYLHDASNTGILRGVHPERTAEVLRSAQDDRRRAQNDSFRAFLSSLINSPALLEAAQK